jgi:hypothetical protein
MPMPIPHNAPDSSPSSPLLPYPTSPTSRAAANGPGRLPSLRGAARFLRRTGSRRLMREQARRRARRALVAGLLGGDDAGGGHGRITPIVGLTAAAQP